MARRSERSSAALSTKWNNLHRNFYHLQGITEKQNELLSTPICLKGILLCTWLQNAFSSSTVVSNHMLSLLQSGEPLLYCIVVLAASCSSVVLSAATRQCPQTYSKNILTSLPLTNVLSHSCLCQNSPQKGFWVCVSGEEHAVFHLRCSVLLFSCSGCMITTYGEFIFCFVTMLTFKLISHTHSIYQWYWCKSPSQNCHLLRVPSTALSLNTSTCTILVN